MVGRIIYFLFFLVICSSTSYAVDASDLKEACYQDATRYCSDILRSDPPTRKELIACGYRLLAMSKVINPNCYHMLKEFEKEGKLS